MKKGTIVKQNVSKFKSGRQLKDFVPQTTNIQRELTSLVPPDQFSRDFIPYLEPKKLFPEWPGDEEAKVKYNIFLNRNLILE